MDAPRRSLLSRIGDYAIPWGVFVFVAMVVLDHYPDGDPFGLLLFGVLLAAAQGLAMRWRRTHPEAVLAVCIAGGLGIQILAPETIVPFAALLAIGWVAAARPPRESLPALGAVIALCAVDFFTASVADTFFTMGLAVGAWALGEASRNRRVALVEERRRAVTEEQARIARELHDVIAHSVSVIVVQAAAADDVFDTRPDEARAALRSIEGAGREAMLELRRLLAAVEPGEDGETSPQPGLDRLDALADSVRAGGLAVEVSRDDGGAQLPAGVDLSAFRIVQEALTNTLRHAGASRAEVTIRRDGESVEVEITDDGSGAAPAAPNAGGRGLAGMRERAALLGGTLEAGGLPGGGFRVHARLPVGDDA